MSRRGGGRVDNPYATNAYATSYGANAGTASGALVPYGGYGGYDDGTGRYGPIGEDGANYQAGRKRKGAWRFKFMDAVKNTMAVAKRDNWKVVIVNATNHDLAAPRGKHVRAIMQGIELGGSISNRESPVGAIFYHLHKRMQAEKWVVSVKAQTIFHLIFREGNEKFVGYIASNARNAFRMEFFAAESTESLACAPFIKTYASFLEQRLAMKAAIDFPVGKSQEGDPGNSARYQESEVEELLAVAPVIMDTIEKIIAIDFAGQIQHTIVSPPALSMILRDFSLFWIGLTDSMIRLLHLYFNLDTSNATIAFDVYKRYVEIVRSSEQFFEITSTLPIRWQPPYIGSVSIELADSMEEYLNKGPEDFKKSEPLYVEERYEPVRQPPPRPDYFYLPEPVFYTSEEEEPEPLPRRRSLSEDSESSSDESSSEGEPETVAAAPPMAQPPPSRRPFDPLRDMLGITTGVGSSSAVGSSSVAQAPQNQVALYNGAHAGIPQRATLEQTAEDRVANVKGVMGASSGGQPASHNQVALYGNNARALTSTAQQQQLWRQQQQQQQMVAYQTMQQAQMNAYQTMAAYNSMGAYHTMTPQQQMALQVQANPVYAQQVQAGLMAQYQQQQQHAQSAVPVMPAQLVAQNRAAYRVSNAGRASQQPRVNDSDKAFGPIVEEMKRRYQ